jgi:hypothetical protein
MAIDGTHLAVTLDGRDGKTINFDAANFGKLRHAYAGTIHTGQGDSIAQCYLYHSEHWRSAPAYVALTRHKENTELFVAASTAKDVTELARQVARRDETRAASQFYQQDPIGPVRPMNAADILAQFAGDDFTRAAERMEREAKHWPGARHYDPAPKPPWPSLRERQPGFYRQDDSPPVTAGLESDVATRDADDLVERVQRIIDDPTREADERDDRVLQALYARREAEATPAAAADESRGVEATSDVPEEAGTSEEQQALDSAVSSREMTDDKQASYSRYSGSLLGSAGQPSRPAETRTAGGGGRSRTR